jgi:mannosylglycerate hydrolase
MKNIHVVSHTHWDREWYRPFEYFRSKLVFVVDKLLALLEKDDTFKHFLLDGQSIPLEDYLQIKPENRERLATLVASGRLIVGPWYIQPDEFAPDGESHIRNLMLGMRIAREFGDPMLVGYLPDSFGHSGQMPHILNGFDIHYAVVMRGVPEDDISASEFIWEADNGDEVLAVYLPHGYSNALFMPDKYTPFKLRMAAAVKQLDKWSPGGNYLVMNGVDHQFPQAHVPAFLEKMNEDAKKEKYIHSTIENYIAAVLESGAEFDCVQGELICPASQRVHTSIASTRIYQKQQNRRLEALLERYMEPVAAAAWLAGAEYPQGLLRQAWKYLIQNQTHDGLGGCCTDEVHREMDQRFTSARIIGETLVRNYSRALAKRISPDKLTLTVFNSAMTRGRQLVRASLYVKKENFSLEDMEGNPVPYQVEHIEDVDVSQRSIWTLYLGSAQILKKMDICFYTDFEFNTGYKVLRVNERKRARELEGEIAIKGNVIENRYYTVVICENGSINLYDKELGRQFQNLHLFEDCGDAGDTYNYSPVKRDTVITSQDTPARFEVEQYGAQQVTLRIDLDLEIPRSLTADDRARSTETVMLPITSYMTIYSDIKRIDFKTEIENTARDHRLRILFQTGIQSQYSYAETQFGTIQRDNRRDDAHWKRKGWKEKPLPIYPQQRFVDLNDGQWGMAVLNRGLPEYEIYDDTTIAVTLVRSVGAMGKKDLLIRPGRYSGISLPTPDAQCPGRQTLEYAILPHAGDVDAGQVAKSAAEFDAPALAVQNKFWRERLLSKEKLVGAFGSIENMTSHIHDQMDELALEDGAFLTCEHNALQVSAFKKAEDEEALVVRLYNAGSEILEDIPLQLGMAVKEAWLTNFDEENRQRLDVSDGSLIRLPLVKAYSAVTLKFILE